MEMLPLPEPQQSRAPSIVVMKTEGQVQVLAHVWMGGVWGGQLHRNLQLSSHTQQETSIPGFCLGVGGGLSAASPKHIILLD
jgi:hypothetical protein